jgi:hypothetical protein
MRKIINGRKYDTDTAKRVCCYDNGCYITDIYYYSETLFKKKTGEFFILVEGGACSQANEYLGKGCYIGGKNIIPISEIRAKKFVELNGSVEEYEELFGKVEE